MSDDYFDLIVWYAADGSVHGFQLCYERLRDERAVTWMRGEGFRHDQVDTGDSGPTKNGTPILFAGGVFAGESVLSEFRKRSEQLSPEIRQLVLSRLAEFLEAS
jgi:hypothetical protein